MMNIVKGGHNSFPSQITTRPPKPTAHKPKTTILNSIEIPIFSIDSKQWLHYIVKCNKEDINMLNTRKVDGFIYDIENCLRSHAAAAAERRKIRSEIADIAIAGEEISEKLKSDLADAEFRIGFYKESLDNAKQQFIDMINSININDNE